MTLNAPDILKLKARYLSPDFPCPPEGTALGARCTPDKTCFSLWSPLARSVRLNLEAREIPMERDAFGVWSAEVPGDLHGASYSYTLDHGDGPVESGDPYARACGCSSRRCMAVDLRRTDPPGWDRDQTPALPSEAVIYELHVKEFSWQEAGGFSFRGKYKAFTEAHTTLHNDGIHPTGLDYLRELGVTHIQLMPVFDYGSVDDTDPEAFNWGYDPLYYNIPEGSYSTDPHHGEVRIREFKEMVQSLHAHGFRVIMDVVYNHTYSLDSPFNHVVPWYYYRTDAQGQPSNGSACGNDFASEMPMAGRFILESVLYWAEEYHIDGFRFDLMGLLDVGLMNRIRSALDERFGPGEKLMFGEPWAAAETAMLPGHLQALKENISLLDAHIGMFSDDIRDSVRGHVFDSRIKGFVTGGEDTEENILDCAACRLPGHPLPSQIVSYVSAHDNHTLWDKLGQSFPEEETRLAANRLAAAIYMTCPGHLFLLSGEEFARTKDGHDNTYNESIALNRLDWERAWEFASLRDYYRGLIALRKRCPGLCNKTPGERISHAILQPGAVGFCVDNLCIFFNRNETPVEFPLPEGSWQVLADGESSFPSPVILTERAEAPPLSALILGPGKL